MHLPNLHRYIPRPVDLVVVSLVDINPTAPCGLTSCPGSAYRTKYLPDTHVGKTRPSTRSSSPSAPRPCPARDPSIRRRPWAGTPRRTHLPTTFSDADHNRKFRSSSHHQRLVRHVLAVCPVRSSESWPLIYRNPRPCPFCDQQEVLALDPAVAFWAAPTLASGRWMKTLA